MSPGIQLAVSTFVKISVCTVDPKEANIGLGVLIDFLFFQYKSRNYGIIFVNQKVTEELLKEVMTTNYWH